MVMRNSIAFSEMIKTKLILKLFIRLQIEVIEFVNLYELQGDLESYWLIVDFLIENKFFWETQKLRGL